jgi:integrase
VKAAEVAEAEAFWDWALLELLLQSGVRIEEAGELTTLDVLRRRHSDGRVYYMLHVKPSKYDRARVIPIGDGLGRVIAEIIRHVKRFYGTDRVPACDHYDSSEKVALPRAPYLLQGCRHPSAIAYAAIRSRLARLSQLAGVTCADGSPLIVRPHDCRRLFASEHLNNNTPVHVIQALLGHASIDTVMVYAKLYPSTLVEERPGRSPHASWRSSGSRAPCAAPTNSPMVSPARSRAKPHKPKPRTQARAIEGRMGARRRRPTRPSHAIDTRVAGS